MKKFSIIVFFLAAVLTTACSIEETSFDNNIETKRLTIQAAGEDYGIIDSPETRTMRNEKTKATLWTKGDAISLFYGSGTKGGSKFTSTQEEDTVHVANFTGQISVITGGGESVTEQDTYFWGLYPYDSSASCDGTSITTTLPSNQVATPGTFANNLFPSLGHSQGLIMGFYNICGGLRFSVTKEGVKRVTLKGNNGEKIAGKYKVSLESGLPVSTADETSGKTEIVLEPPVGEFFKPGKNYYFVMIPTVFSQGFTLTFETLNETGIYERSVSTSIKRSMFSGLSNVDQNVSYSTPEGDNLLEQYMDDLYQSLYKGFTKNYTGQAVGTPLDAYSSVMDIDKNWRSAVPVTQGSMTSATSGVYNRYKMYYDQISCANNIIASLNNNSGSDLNAVVKAKYKSEALFMRAWAYYYLNVLFHGVPLFLEDDDPETEKLPRSTETEVWNQIITDLTACINEPNLPNKTTDGRVSKGAAFAYRGIAYQHMEDWSKALADFEAVGNLGYKLYSPSNGAPDNTDFFDVLRPENENCDEHIFKVNCIEEVGRGNPRSINYGSRCTGGSAWNNYIPNPSHVERFENADGSDFDWEDYCPGYKDLSVKQRIVFFLRDGLIDSSNGVYGTGNYAFNAIRYQNMVAYCEDGGTAMQNYYLDNGNEARIRQAYENRDPRLEMSIITPYAPYNGYASGVGNHTWTLRWPYIIDTNEPYDLRTDAPWAFYYLWRKYVAEGEECTTRWAYTQDIILVRYAEILLRRAECLNELGRTSEAVQFVDMVRSRAGHIKLSDPGYQGTEFYSQAGMRKKIHNEFYVELGGEDSMYFNELRWGIWHQVKFYNQTQYAYDAPALGSNGLMEIWGKTYYSNLDVPALRSSFAWPIPAKEIENNPLLTQNEGW